MIIKLDLVEFSAEKNLTPSPILLFYFFFPRWKRWKEENKNLIEEHKADSLS